MRPTQVAVNIPDINSSHLDMAPLGDSLTWTNHSTSNPSHSPNASWELFICFESSRTENFDVEHPRVATFKGHQSIIFQTLVRGLYVAVHLTKLRTIKWLQTLINYSGCPTQTNWCHFHEIIHPSVYPTAPRFVILFEQCSKTRCHYWLVENRIPHGSNRLVIFGEYDPRNNHPIGFLNTAHLIPAMVSQTSAKAVDPRRSLLCRLPVSQGKWGQGRLVWETIDLPVELGQFKKCLNLWFTILPTISW